MMAYRNTATTSHVRAMDAARIHPARPSLRRKTDPSNQLTTGARR